MQFDIAPNPCPLQLFLSRVSAGFPSPADDHADGPLDLQQLLIRSPPSTFLWQVDGSGESMTGAGIYPGDLLVVDRALRPIHRDIVVAIVAGDLTVKRLVLEGPGAPCLQPENPRFPPIPITEDLDVVVWGVVTWNLHRLRGRGPTGTRPSPGSAPSRGARPSRGGNGRR
jgi:DNA polymerase V